MGCRGFTQPTANATSTGSLSLKDCRSHPVSLALLLAMPREAAAVGAAPSDTTTTLAEEGGRPSLREVHADDHDRRDGMHVGPSQSSPRFEQGRVVPRQSDPVNYIVREVVGVRAH